MKEFMFGKSTNLPMMLVVGLITMAWLSFLSVVIFS